MADVHQLDVDAGATWTETVTWREPTVAGVLGALINLTGYTARMQLRVTVDAADAVLSLTHLAGLTLGGAAGTVLITMTAAQTGALSGIYEYDLEVESAGGVVTRLIQGEVHVSPECTR